MICIDNSMKLLSCTKNITPTLKPASVDDHHIALQHAHFELVLQFCPTQLFSYGRSI